MDREFFIHENNHFVVVPGYSLNFSNPGELRFSPSLILLPAAFSAIDDDDVKNCIKWAH